MVFQVLAMWLVAAGAIAWFMHDEKRRHDARLDAQARVYARVPHYRREAPAVVERPLPQVMRPATLRSADRAYLQNLARTGKPGC